MAARPHFVHWNRSVPVVAHHYDPRPRKLDLRQYQPLLPAFAPKYPETFRRITHTLASRGFRNSENVSIRVEWIQCPEAYPPWWQRFGRQLGPPLSTEWMGRSGVWVSLGFGTVGQIPVDRRCQPLLQGHLRLPPERDIRSRSVDPATWLSVRFGTIPS